MALDALKKLASETGSGHGGTAAAPTLIRKQSMEKQAVQQAADVYAEHQKAIKQSAQLKSEILKGLQNGENLAALLLKAVQAISCVTGDTVFYDQTKERIYSIYGNALQEPAAVELMQNEIRGRLERLEEAEKKWPDDNNIAAAIRSHRKQLNMPEKWE